jgi:hypothetical protein
MRSESRTISIPKPREFSNKRQAYGANWLTSNNAALFLFQPDVLLTSEFFEGARTERKDDPTRKLMLAILEDAINCLQYYASDSSEKGRILFHDARTWIMDRDDPWIFSFENICELLELNPDFIRGGLQRWEGRRRTAQEQAAGS